MPSLTKHTKEQTVELMKELGVDCAFLRMTDEHKSVLPEQPRMRVRVSPTSPLRPTAPLSFHHSIQCCNVRVAFIPGFDLQCRPSMARPSPTLDTVVSGQRRRLSPSTPLLVLTLPTALEGAPEENDDNDESYGRTIWWV